MNISFPFPVVNRLHPLPPIQFIRAFKPCCLLFEPVRAEVNSHWCGNGWLWYSSLCCRQSVSGFCLHPRATVHFKRARPKIQNTHKYTNKPRKDTRTKEPLSCGSPDRSPCCVKSVPNFPTSGIPSQTCQYLWSGNCEITNFVRKSASTILQCNVKIQTFRVALDRSVWINVHKFSK